MKMSQKALGHHAPSSAKKVRHALPESCQALDAHQPGPGPPPPAPTRGGVGGWVLVRGTPSPPPTGPPPPRPAGKGVSAGFLLGARPAPGPAPPSATPRPTPGGRAAGVSG